MRACVLLHELGRSGGVQTILRHARALAGAELVVTGAHPGDLPAEVGGVRVRTLADARGERYDCAIATWWATAAALWEVDAARRLVFLQSVESRFYEEREFPERFAAEAVLALPVGFVVVAPWMRDLLAELRPDAQCRVVLNGIDKEVFRPRAEAPGEAGAPPAGEAGAAPPAGAPPPGEAGAASPAPLRVLVEGQPSMWFKGVHEGLAAVGAMSEPAEATVVAADPAAAGDLDGVRVTGGLDAAGMAAEYARHDVLLKLSRVEGLALGPLEAFHTGVPAVLAPFTGHEEYAEHGRNALVVGFDDQPGTARALDRLAADRELLRRLGEGALATAAEWPSAEDAGAAFADAVRDLCDAPAPDEALAHAAMERARTRWLELGRDHVRQQAAIRDGLRGAVRWHENALEEAAEHNADLNRMLHESWERERGLLASIEELKDTRAYRLAEQLRRLKPGRRP